MKKLNAYSALSLFMTGINRELSKLYLRWLSKPPSGNVKLKHPCPGDGQVDFAGIFSKLIQHGYDSWAVMEWECCIKSPQQGAAEGAPFIASHMIDVTEVAFDDFAGGERDDAQIKRMLGL